MREDPTERPPDPDFNSMRRLVALPPLVKPRTAGRTFRAALAAVLLATVWSARSASAYVPPEDDLWARLAEGVPPIHSAIVETENLVYDPDALQPDAAEPGRSAPEPIKARAFRQRLYWQRGSLLAVETLAADGGLAHLFLSNGYRTYSRALASRTVFSDADLRPVLFPFLEGSAAAWREELVFWGIQPLSVDLVLSGATAFIRLGEGGDSSLWIDRMSDLPARLTTRIPAPTPLRIELRFGDFMPVAPSDEDRGNPRLPKTVSYEVNGRLFRKTTVIDVQADVPGRAFPLARWRQLLEIPETPPVYAFGRPEAIR
ncbi:MAG: hypothetical protein ACHQZQ_08095 [SAR324 cluster bacterium]